MGRKGPEISPEVRKLAVDQRQNGHRLCEISELLQLSYMTVSNIVKKIFAKLICGKLGKMWQAKSC